MLSNLHQVLRTKGVKEFGTKLRCHCGVRVFIALVLQILRDFDTMIRGVVQCRKLTESERFRSKSGSWESYRYIERKPLRPFWAPSTKNTLTGFVRVPGLGPRPPLCYMYTFELIEIINLLYKQFFFTVNMGTNTNKPIYIRHSNEIQIAT